MSNLVEIMSGMTSLKIFWTNTELECHMLNCKLILDTPEKNPPIPENTSLIPIPKHTYTHEHSLMKGMKKITPPFTFYFSLLALTNMRFL